MAKPDSHDLLCRSEQLFTFKANCRRPRLPRPPRFPLPFGALIERLVPRSLLDVLPLAMYRALNGGVPLLLGLYIGSRWGIAELGGFTVAVAFLAVVTVIADWGCTRFVPREVAQHEGWTPHASSATGIRFVIASVMIAAGALYGLSGGFDRDVLGYLLLLAPVAFSSIIATNGVSVHVVEGSMNAITRAIIAGLMPLAAAVALTYVFPLGVRTLVAGYVIGKLAEAAVMVWGRLQLLHVSFAHARSVFLSLLPFSFHATFGAIYSRVPIFALERWSTRTELGIVSAAVTILNVVLLLPTSMTLFAYPRLAAAGHDGDRKRIAAIVKRYTFGSVAIYAAGLVAFWLAKDIVAGLLHMPAGASSFLVFWVAAGSMTIVNVMSGAVLQAVSAEKVAARIGALALVFALPVQVMAVRRMGMWGALLALVICETGALTIYSLAAARALRCLHPSPHAREQDLAPVLIASELE
jgi:O-antigen/teichoic acid export membrane protein